MNDIIILEYFTSKSNITLENKKIFSEAVDLVENIIKNFLLNKNVNKVFFVQNSKFNILNHKRLFKTYTRTIKKLTRSFTNGSR